MTLFDSNWDDEPVRLLGISVSDFASDAQMISQLDLFNPVDEAKLETSQVLKELNREITGAKLVRASEILK